MIYPTFIPLGVSDPEGHIGAIKRSGGGIDLLDLLTGEVIRQWHEFDHVLMVYQGRLIGWETHLKSHLLRLFVVNLRSKDGEAQWSGTVEFPDWVDLRSGSENDPAFRFGVEDDRYILFCRMRNQQFGGAPPQEDRDPIPQFINKRIEFDIRTLKIRCLQDRDGFDREQQGKNLGEHLARHAGGFVYRQAGKLHNAPWTIDGSHRYLRTDSAPEGEEQILSIIQGIDPEAKAIVRVKAYQPAQTVPELSLDGRHLAIVEHQCGSRVWHIYDTFNGTLVCTIPFQDTMRAFRVFEERLLLLEENILDSNQSTITMENTIYSLDMRSQNSMWCYSSGQIEILNTFQPAPSH